MKKKTKKKLKSSRKQFCGIPRGIMAHELVFDRVVSESKLQSWYYVHFWTNTLKKGMNACIPTSSSELDSTTIVFLLGWPWHLSMDQPRRVILCQGHPIKQNKTMLLNKEKKQQQKTQKNKLMKPRQC